MRSTEDSGGQRGGDSAAFNPFLQGTQATSKPNDPKKKFKGKIKKVAVDTVALKGRMDSDSGRIEAEDDPSRRKALMDVMGERADTLRTLRGKPFTDSTVDPGSLKVAPHKDNKPLAPQQPTTIADSPTEPDDDDDGKAIHALITDTRSGDRAGASSRFMAYATDKKKFQGKPKGKG